MYSKHHESRRQNAARMLGVSHKSMGGRMEHKNMGGPLGVPDSENINRANQMLRNSATNLNGIGAKSGGFIGQTLRNSLMNLTRMAKEPAASQNGNGVGAKRGGYMGNKRTCKADGGSLGAPDTANNAYRRGGLAKAKHGRHCKADGGELGASNGYRHGGKAHEPREGFAMGGVGKIRHKQMTMSGKPIPAPRHHKMTRKDSAREIY